MNLGRLNQWLLLAANLGVLVGIIFLSIEIRQNTLTIRGAAIQSASALSREQMFVIMQNAELSRIAVEGLASPLGLSEVDAFRASYMVRTFWVGMQANYRQWALGILPEEEWAYYRRTMCSIYGLPGGQHYWQADRSLFIPEFVAAVEQCAPPADASTFSE